MSWGEKIGLLGAGVIPFLIFFSVTGLFLMGYTSPVESFAVGAAGATLAAIFRRRMNCSGVAANQRVT
jgi:TRAP-type mannitol/chloroaromatic compound transport system permease large subunit